MVLNGAIGSNGTGPASSHPQAIIAEKRSCFTRPQSGAHRLTLIVELTPGLPLEEAERRAVLGLRAGDGGNRVAAYYLVDLDERGAYQEWGYRSIVQYGEMRLHREAATIRELLATGRALLDLPEIDRALCEERLSWSQARALVRVAVAETESAWLEWAARRTVREIVANTSGRRKGELPTDPHRRRIHEIAFTVRGRFSVVQNELWNSAKAKFEAEGGEPVSDTELMLEAALLILHTRPDGTVPGRKAVK